MAFRQLPPENHSEIGQTPEKCYQKGLGVIRQVDMARVMESFLQSVRAPSIKPLPMFRSTTAITASIPNCAEIGCKCTSIPFQPGIPFKSIPWMAQYLGTGSLYDRI